MVVLVWIVAVGGMGGWNCVRYGVQEERDYGVS
jgi:hypothetical protein